MHFHPRDGAQPGGTKSFSSENIYEKKKKNKNWNFRPMKQSMEGNYSTVQDSQ